ncbi:MAG: exopolysaccharide biosynthesis polyprenyl glycosylphosphotransferase [Ilumatobacteraceae bacterium]
MSDVTAGETTGERTGADRRGPFRPARLITLRDRQSRREAAHGFRLVDVIALAVISVVTLTVVSPGSPLDLPVSRALPVVVSALATGRLLRSLGRYRFGRHERLVSHLLGVLGAVVVGVAFGCLTAEIVRRDAHVRDVLVSWAVPAALGLVALHAAWYSMVMRWRSQGRLTPNIVIVGATRHAEDIVADALAQRDVNVLGIFDDRLSRAPRDIAGVPVLGTVADLIGHRMTPFLDLIVVAVDPAARERVRDLTQRLSVLPNDTALVVDDDGTGRHAAIRRLADAPLSPLDVVADPGRRAFAKRVQDVVMSATMLVVLSPLIAVIAIAVRTGSPGPTFFRQRRHGFNNEEIVVWKFRTMRVDATDEHAHQQVTANDARVTKVGRILRAASLDELPQLLNVLHGTMSLVGPRPHAIGMRTGEEESAGLVAEYAQRHRIKPGMTGWAAIHGSRGPLHSPDDVRRRVALDIDYIDRQSFWLDVWILLMTVPSVFGDRTAIR